MEGNENVIIEIIQRLIQILPDWTILTKIIVGWVAIEKFLKVIAKITPWQWDDDLVELVSKILAPLKPTKKTPK